MDAPQARCSLRPLLRRLCSGFGGGSFPWTFAAALGFITLNSGMAIYGSKHDGAIINFVVSAYLDLVLLFCFLWLYKTAAAGSPRRERLKASIWVITTLLSFSFAYIVMGERSAVLTLPLAVLCFVMAAATGVAAFLTFFNEARVNQPRDEAVLPPV